MVNGAQHRVEIVAVTAVPPSTVTGVADEDDARRRRHATPQRVAAPSRPGGTAAGSSLLVLSDADLMPPPDGPPLPVAHCVLCRWPMNESVNIVEIRVGAVAVFRACAGECPPPDVDRNRALDRKRYINERQAEARRVDREMSKIRDSFDDLGHLMDLMRRYAVLLGLDAPVRVEVDPSSAAGRSPAEIAQSVREQLRREDAEQA
jgi:hypothetical protein